MSFLGHFLGGIGDAARERNLTNMAYEHQAHTEFANHLESLAGTAKPQYQADYLKAALAIRMTPPGKKPPKWAMDLPGLMQKQISDTHQAAMGQPPSQDAAGDPSQSAPGGASPASIPPPPQAATPVDAIQAGQPTGPAPALPPPPSMQGASAPNTAGAGMASTGLTAPPATEFTQYTPMERADMEAHAEQRKYEAQNKAIQERNIQTAMFEKSQRADTLKTLEAGGVKLSPRERAEILSGQKMAPEARRAVPGMGLSSTLPPGTVDASTGQPIDPTKTPFVRTVMTENGPEYFGQLGSTTTRLIHDPNSETQWTTQVNDHLGNEVSRMTGATPPAAFAPTTTSGSHGQITQVVGADGKEHNVVVPVGSSSTTQRMVPGMAKSTGVTLAAPPKGVGTKGKMAAQPSTSSNLPGRDLGVSPSQYKRDIEQPLTKDAVKVIADNEPVMKQLDRALEMLKGAESDNTPYRDWLKRKGYGLGSASDVSPLINNLELGKVIGAARVLKGSSRAMSAMNIAMTHLPDPGKDSPRLMVEKIRNIKQNLTDINDAAREYGAKYPGMQAPPSGDFSVHAPNGKTYKFNSAADLANFKAKAGL
jgi:hypothetical protein